MGYSSLEIGKRSLIASKIALDLTSNNIANVNTDGYSRRIASTSEAEPLATGNGFIGTGVLIDKIKNYREDFFDKEIRATDSRKSGFDKDTEILQRVQAILAEPSDLGMNELVSNFLNQFEDLSLKPEDISLRQNVLMIAQRLVDRSHEIAQQFTDLKEELVNTAQTNIDKANGLIKDIATLNNEIQKAYSYDKAGAQSYIDERENKLEELAKIVKVTRTDGNYGSINVFLNGNNIITGSVFSPLKLREKINQISGESSLQLFKINGDNSESLVNVDGGELASIFKHYNTTLNEKSKKSDSSLARNFNDFLNALVNKINNFTNKGYDLNSQPSTPLGTNFFEPNANGVSASTIELSNDVKDKPKNIPLSSKPNEPGNSEIARNIARIAVDKNFLNNMTPSEYYTSIIGALGQMSKTAKDSFATSSTVAEQLSNQRESIIGVNLDEEAINLIKFQKSFEASSRIISTTNSILTTLVNLGR